MASADRLAIVLQNLIMREWVILLAFCTALSAEACQLLRIGFAATCLVYGRVLSLWCAQGLLSWLRQVMAVQEQRRRVSCVCLHLACHSTEFLAFSGAQPACSVTEILEPLLQHGQLLLPDRVRLGATCKQAAELVKVQLDEDWCELNMGPEAPVTLFLSCVQFAAATTTWCCGNHIGARRMTRSKSWSAVQAPGMWAWSVCTPTSPPPDLATYHALGDLVVLCICTSMQSLSLRILGPLYMPRLRALSLTAMDEDEAPRQGV